MKISELMERLGEIQGKEGDIEVVVWDGIYADPATVAEVEEYCGKKQVYIA